MHLIIILSSKSEQQPVKYAYNLNKHISNQHAVGRRLIAELKAQHCIFEL